jgi:hypothetical protein
MSFKSERSEWARTAHLCLWAGCIATGAQYHRWASAEPAAAVQQSFNLHGLGPVAEVPGASEDWYFRLPENDRPDEGSVRY